MIYRSKQSIKVKQIIITIIFLIKEIISFYLKQLFEKAKMSLFVKDTQECCICFEVIGNINNCTTQCGHSFCFECISKSLTKKNTCPICRHKLVEDETIVNDNDYMDYEDTDDDESEEVKIQESIMNKEITDRFLREGYNLYDIMSLSTCKYNRQTGNITDDDIDVMLDKLDNIIENVENENKEQQLFQLEDFRHNAA